MEDRSKSLEDSNNDKVGFNEVEKNIADKVSIFANDDVNLKVLGDILSNESSRKILSLLVRKEMTVTEMMANTNYALSLILHHLNNMKEAGIVEISKIGKNSKNHDLKYYVAKSAIIILTKEMAEKAKQSKSFQNSLKRLLRFASVGAAAVISWFASHIIQNHEDINTLSPAGSQPSVSADLFWSTTIALSVIIFGMITERILTCYHKRK